MTTRVSPGGLQPSQPYVDAERLRDVLEWFDPDAPAHDPIPVLPAERFDPGLDADFVIVDGHTRAFVAVLCGSETVRVVRDSERDDLSTGIYRTCVEWCLDAGVTEPADLVGRVVSPGTFREEWIERCQALE